MLAYLIGGWLITGVIGTEAPTYGVCASAPDPIVCVKATAERRREDGDDDHGSARDKRIALIADRALAGDTEQAVTADEAQAALIFIDDDSLGELLTVHIGPGMDHLWTGAMTGLPPRRGAPTQLIWAAARMRPDLLGQIVGAVDPKRRYSPDQRAELASVIARTADDWETATLWMRSGGERARNYDIDGVWAEIAEARLYHGYDAASAARVAAWVLEQNELLPWPEKSLDALKAGKAQVELRSIAAALAVRGRSPERDPDARTDDFGMAAWALQAAGDIDAAIELAREGAKWSPAATRAHRGEPGQARSTWAGDFGTWPLRMLYQLGRKDEALASGLLFGVQRYQMELDMGGEPDPQWLIEDGDWRSVEMVTTRLVGDKNRSPAAKLLAALLADAASPEATDADDPFTRIDHARSLLLLAGLSRDAQALDGIIADALPALDALAATDGDAMSAANLVRAARGARALFADPT